MSCTNPEDSEVISNLQVAQPRALLTTDVPEGRHGWLVALEVGAAFVAQVSKPAVSPTSKSAGVTWIRARGFGNPRHRRLGSLRHVG